MHVLGYVRVSTAEQADSGLGLAAQRSVIQAEADRRGWTVEFIEDAGQSGKSMSRRGIQHALDLLRTRKADALVVAKLDRLSRSVQDFAATLATSHKQGWALIALDLGIDTSTPAGELVATVMAAVSQWERKAIGQRTRVALAERKAQGYKLGRPSNVAPEILRRILDDRSAGMSTTAIARDLTQTGIPAPGGGHSWHPSTISRIERAAVALKP